MRLVLNALKLFAGPAVAADMCLYSCCYVQPFWTYSLHALKAMPPH